MVAHEEVVISTRVALSIRTSSALGTGRTSTPIGIQKWPLGQVQRVIVAHQLLSIALCFAFPTGPKNVLGWTVVRVAPATAVVAKNSSQVCRVVVAEIHRNCNRRRSVVLLDGKNVVRRCKGNFSACKAMRVIHDQKWHTWIHSCQLRQTNDKFKIRSTRIRHDVAKNNHSRWLVLVERVIGPANVVAIETGATIRVRPLVRTSRVIAIWVSGRVGSDNQGLAVDQIKCKKLGACIFETSCDRSRSVTTLNRGSVQATTWPRRSRRKRALVKRKQVLFPKSVCFYGSICTGRNGKGIKAKLRR